MCRKGSLPAHKLFTGQPVDTACLLTGQLACGDGGHDRSLEAGGPTSDLGRRGIVFRTMQGLCGGAITPTVWPVVYTKFRGRQLATVIAIISVILSLSSTVGPTLGGFLTDRFSWNWLFW